jgi:hypothetical protein
MNFPNVPIPIYFLCAITSAVVSVTLLVNYRRTRVRFLLWCSICFGCLFLNNLLLFFDMVVFDENIDLSVLRTLPVVAGVVVLLYGFIWDVT